MNGLSVGRFCSARCLFVHCCRTETVLANKYSPPPLDNTVHPIVDKLAQWKVVQPVARIMATCHPVARPDSVHINLCSMMITVELDWSISAN